MSRAELSAWAPHQAPASHDQRRSEPLKLSPPRRARRTSQPRRVSAERWSHLADSLLDAVARGLVPNLGLVGVDHSASCPNSAVAFRKRLAGEVTQ